MTISKCLTLYFYLNGQSKGGDEIPQADLVINIEKLEDDLQRFVTLSLNDENLYQALKETLES